MNLSPNRLIALVLIDLLIFGISAVVLLQFMPKPLRPFDYLIVGGVSTLISLLGVWILVWRELPNRTAFLFEKRPKK